jgi:hypothetical protein
MTWWTEEGHVVAPKAVVDLLTQAALRLRDESLEEIRLGDPDLHPDTGVSLFDHLDPKTQIFALAYVLKHLSDPELQSPVLAAWTEATLFALF